jgi:hypothetical protein
MAGDCYEHRPSAERHKRTTCAWHTHSAIRVGATAETGTRRDAFFACREIRSSGRFDFSHGRKRHEPSGETCRAVAAPPANIRVAAMMIMLLMIAPLPILT